MALPRPATGVELYLDAILDELRALRVAVEGGGRAPAAVEAAPEPAAVASAAGSAPTATKRTRTRTRAGER